MFCYKTNANDILLYNSIIKKPNIPNFKSMHKSHLNGCYPDEATHSDNPKVAALMRTFSTVVRSIGTLFHTTENSQISDSYILEVNRPFSSRLFFDGNDINCLLLCFFPISRCSIGSSFVRSW